MKYVMVLLDPKVEEYPANFNDAYAVVSLN
jgi:hypothetical protein